jgi:hypothetical protein
MIHPLDLDLDQESTVLIVIEHLAGIFEAAAADLILEILGLKQLLGVLELIDVGGIKYSINGFELFIDRAVTELEAARKVDCLIGLVIGGLAVEVTRIDLKGEDPHSVPQVVLQAIVHEGESPPPFLLVECLTEVLQLVLHYRVATSEPSIHAHFCFNREKRVLGEGEVYHLAVQVIIHGQILGQGVDLVGD